MFPRMLLVLLLLAPMALAADSSEVEQAAPAPTKGTVYGAALSEVEAVPVSKILATPDEFVGKKVKISGTVIAVCAKRGCWMELAGDQEFQKMRIKVEDGVIVFPMDAIGHQAVAEGVFTKHELSLEQTKAMVQHQCEEKGEKFDPASVTECQVLYQIAGSGAVIH